MKLEKNAKIFVAGHNGLVGSAIWNNLKARGYNNLIGRSHKELDLTNQAEVTKFFDEQRPDAVVLAAAFVGGIMANSLYRADFIMQNMKMQCNVIENAYKHGVKKLLFLGSTCIYPKNAPQPMREDCLLTSPLEYTNEEYAIAKIAGLKMCESYNLQYGTNYIAVMPTNLYGPNDNFHLENSHVMPAMMRKIFLAKQIADGNWTAIRKDLTIRPVGANMKLSDNAPTSRVVIDGTSDENTILSVLKWYGIENNKVVLWGTGSPLREFLWSEEMADASVYIMEKVDFADLCKGQGPDIRNTHINIGTGVEHTIREVAQMVCRVVGFTGTVNFDASKPDGTLRKLTDVSKLHKLGWHHQVELEEGIDRLYQWYLKNS